MKTGISFCLQCTDAVWFGVRKSIRPVKMSDKVFVRLSVWIEVQIVCIYVPTDAAVIPQPSHLLTHLNLDCFTFLVPLYTGCLGKKKPLIGYSGSVVRKIAQIVQLSVCCERECVYTKSRYNDFHYSSWQHKLNKTVIDCRLRPLCCHLGSYFK